MAQAIDAAIRAHKELEVLLTQARRAALNGDMPAAKRICARACDQLWRVRARIHACLRLGVTTEV